MMRIFIYFLVVFYAAEVFASQIKVVDGDSLVVDGRRVRVEGIDAPEYGQMCFTAKGEEYDCGDIATAYMKKLVALGKVTCVEKGIDRYKRSLSECFVEDEKTGETLNINLEMIKSGWAVVYLTDNPAYIKAEKAAKKAKIGMWQGKFMIPELHRMLHRR